MADHAGARLILRVALLTNFIPPYRLSLYQALAREFDDFRVFVSTAMERNRDWSADWGDLQVTVQRSLTLRRAWKTEQFTEEYDLHAPYDTIAQLRRWRPDAVITGELGARSLQALLFCRHARVPCVLWATLSERTEAGRGWSRRALRSYLIPRFDAAIVNGESGARYLRRFGLPDDRLVRVPYTTDMEPFWQLPLQGDNRRLLYVGALSERKGVRWLVEAAAGLPLTIVGNGPLRAELEAQAPSAEWAGHAEYHELPRWYQRGGLLVFPTVADEWGVVVNEALAAGVPVIGSTYSQAVDELIADEINGWRFEADGTAPCRAAIERALGTPAETLAHMREAARASSRALTPGAAALKIGTLLKSVCARETPSFSH